MGQIFRKPITLFYCPLCTSSEDVVYLGRCESDFAFRAHTRWHNLEESINQGFKMGQDLVSSETGQQVSDPAGNIIADSAYGDNTAVIRIKGRYSANGKTIAPMGIRHGNGSLHNSRQ